MQADSGPITAHYSVEAPDG